MTQAPAIAPSKTPWMLLRAWRRCQGWWGRFPSTPMLWTLLAAITALGGFLRFWRLGYQSYWTDETRTIFRTFGSLTRMAENLADQGFPPGWYVLIRAWAQVQEWRLGSGAAAFAPESLRLLPAFLGTLTVPAIYFLARQFIDRRGALLVMLLGAVNPFLIYYARDIKMYGPLWCFVTLNLALFFQWQTTRRHWLWFPLYTLTGFLMVAMHSMSWFIVGLQLIFLLTRPKPKWLDVILWPISVFSWSLLPIWWYMHRTNWVAKVVEQEYDGGLSWIRRYTEMDWKTILSLPSAEIFGFLWPENPVTRKIRDWFVLGQDYSKIDWLASAELWIIIGLLAVLLLGLFPWRGRQGGSGEERVTRGRWWWVALWIIVPTVVLALTWLPRDTFWYRAIWGQRGRVAPVWEPRYLGIICPALLLWLAVAIRRLPLAPLRMLIIAAVLAISTASALTNHLLYRQTPWSRTANVIMRHYEKDRPEALRVILPVTAHAGISDVYTFDLARGERPGYSNRYNNKLRWTVASDREYRNQVEAQLWNPRVRVLIVTDRLGEFTDAKHPLSNESLGGLLGPDWQLASEETYRWHYEWRFYIYHTWRTRVWVRKG